jgi:hypothetical protein
VDRLVGVLTRFSTLALVVGLVLGLVGWDTWPERLAGAGIAGLVSIPVLELVGLRERFRRAGQGRYAALTTLLLVVLALTAAASALRHL